jgi:hypothetical protein
MTQRRYDEAEVRAILGRAIDSRDRSRPAVEQGLTLADIQAIGAEVGIDGASLEEAARSMEVDRPRSAGLLGARTQESVHRDVTGADGTALATGDVLAVIRRTMERAGSLTELDDVLEWRETGEFGQRVVTIATHTDRTSLTGLADLSGAAILTYVPGGLLGTMMSFIAFTQMAEAGSELGMMLCVVAVPALFLLLRTIFGRYADREVERLTRTVDTLADLLFKAAED